MKNYLYAFLLLGLASNLYGMEKETAFTFKTQDGQEFQVEQSVAYQSQFLKNMLEEVSPTELAKTIPLTNINGKRFAAVIEVMQLYANIQTGSDYNKLSKYLNTLSLNDLSTLIVDLNYFLVPPVLLNWAIKKLCDRTIQSGNPIATWQQLVADNNELTTHDISIAVRNTLLQKLTNDFFADSLDMFSMGVISTLPTTASIAAATLSSRPISEFLMAYTNDNDNNINVLRLQTQQVTPLEGHTNIIESLDITPDNTRLISTSQDNTIRVWDLAASQELYQTQDYHFPLNQIISNDSKYCAFISQENQFDTTVELLNLNNGNVISLTPPNERIIVSTISADGKKIVIGTETSIKVWSMDTGQWQDLETTRGNLVIDPAIVQSLAVNPDGTKIIGTSSQEPKMYIWDNGILNIFHDGTEEDPLFEETLFSRDGSLVAAQQDGSIIIFNVNTHDKIQSIDELPANIQSMEFTPDSKSLFVTGYDNTIHLIDIATGTQRTLTTPKNTVIEKVLISRDGNTMATYLAKSDNVSSDNNKIYVWDIKTRKPKTLSGHTGMVQSIAISPDNTTIASGSDDNTIRLWNIKTGKSEVLQGHTTSIDHIFFNANGSKLISISNDTAYLWDLATKTPQNIRLASKSIHNIEKDMHNNYALIDLKEKDYIRVWDLTTGSLDTLAYHVSDVITLAFSPDSKWLASADTKGNIYLYNLSTKESILLGNQARVHLLSFRPDSMQLASGATNGTLLLWDIKLKTSQIIRKNIGNISHLIFNHNGDTLVTLDEDVTIYNPDKKLHYRLAKDDDQKLNIQFFLDSNNILMLEKITSEAEKKIEWWNVDTQEMIKDSDYDFVSISKDGNTLFNNTDDNTLVFQALRLDYIAIFNALIQGVKNFDLSQLFAVKPKLSMIASIAQLPIESRRNFMSLIPEDKIADTLNMLPENIRQQIQEARQPAQ
ncbi:MAG TPA: hypothetical protein PLU71_02145 [Candidatus Dependentiae bacterium]|nr:hypothetical protein [Candidatus Dependentiae bacterium]HRQ62631.1 hypothetical protein [Candidatus Dependentiae bacterium]